MNSLMVLKSDIGIPSNNSIDFSLYRSQLRSDGEVNAVIKIYKKCCIEQTKHDPTQCELLLKEEFCCNHATD